MTGMDSAGKRSHSGDPMGSGRGSAWKDAAGISVPEAIAGAMPGPLVARNRLVFDGLGHFRQADAPTGNQLMLMIGSHFIKDFGS